jgi:hypothetical protein
MDPLQEQFERGVGDRFAEWLSTSAGTSCTFLRRADRAPDLVYSFKGAELFVEVTAAYYDGKHAEFLWKGAREEANAPEGWFGVAPAESLAAAIRARITNKSKKRYGSNTLLLVEVPPGITSAEKLTELLASTACPSDGPFVGIYVAGTFPMSLESTGGYRVVAIKPLVEQ